MLDNTRTEAKKAISIDVGAMLYERTSNGDQRLVGEIVSKTVSDGVMFVSVRHERNNDVRTRSYYKTNEKAHVAL